MNTFLNNTSSNTLSHLKNNSSIGIKHHPQIMDRDTENFKNRLESMLNKFKVDTVSEFMETKRCLLEEQESVLGGQKAQYELKLRSVENDVNLILI